MATTAQVAQQAGVSARAQTHQGAGELDLQADAALVLAGGSDGSTWADPLLEPIADPGRDPLTAVVPTRLRLRSVLGRRPGPRAVR